MNKLLSCRQGRRRHHLCKQRGVHPVRGGAVSHPAPSSGAHRSFDQSRSEINAPARSAQSKKSHARPSGAAWDFFHFRSAVRQMPGSCARTSASSSTRAMRIIAAPPFSAISLVFIVTRNRAGGKWEGPFSAASPSPTAKRKKQQPHSAFGEAAALFFQGRSQFVLTATRMRIFFPPAQPKLSYQPMSL